jgi:hypothetical protein
MACHPEQRRSAGRHFLMRSLVAAFAFTVILYLGGAFLTLDWDFTNWPQGIRASLAVTDLVLGGLVALVAGISAMDGV